MSFWNSLSQMVSDAGTSIASINVGDSARKLVGRGEEFGENETESNSKALKRNKQIGMETSAVKTEPKDDSIIVVDDPLEPTENEPIDNSNEEFGMETCTVKTNSEDDSIIVHDEPIEPIEKDPLAISSFQCESCGMKCKTEKGFKEHLDACFKKKLKTCNNKLPDFALETCDLCLTKVSSIKYPEHRYTCELTLKLNNRKDFLTRHIEGFSKTHCCNDCGEKFSEKAALVHHISLHHEKERIICQVCQKRCDNADRLERHIQRMHINPRKKVKSKRVKCGFCKTEMSSTSLRRHIKNQHPGRK